MNQPMIALLLCATSVCAAQVVAVVPATTSSQTVSAQTSAAPTTSAGSSSMTAQVVAAESAVEQITTTTDTADPMESFLERLRQFQSFGTEDGQISFNADVWLTLDYMVFSTPPPGFIQTSNGQIFAPTLSGLFTLDISKHLEFVFLGLVNRGFDPTETSVQSQPAEYYTQVTPFDTPVLNFKGGKFQTAFGQWTNRHFSTQNSLINAPMMYGQMTSVTDGNANAGIAPNTTAMVDRKNSASPPVTKWIPIVWGPSYASGFQLNGTVGTLQQLDWAFEMKNASLSSRPQEWDLWNRGFNYPTFTGRAGFRPDAAWNLGVSASTGSYISQAAYDRFSNTSKAGSSIGESRQNVVGTDISYAHGPIELWSEFAWSQYEVPDAKAGKSVGNIGAYSYFIESKWKFMPQFWLSGRWNQQLYSNVTPATGPGAGSETPWYNNLWRADACLGFKINRYTQFKVQYSYTEEAGDVDPGQNLFAVELVIQF
jgi:hypothetical protein